MGPRRRLAPAASIPAGGRDPHRRRAAGRGARNVARTRRARRVRPTRRRVARRQVRVPGGPLASAGGTFARAGRRGRAGGVGSRASPGSPLGTSLAPAPASGGLAPRRDPGDRPVALRRPHSRVVPRRHPAPGRQRGRPRSADVPAGRRPRCRRDGEERSPDPADVPGAGRTRASDRRRAGARADPPRAVGEGGRAGRRGPPRPPPRRARGDSGLRLAGDAIRRHGPRPRDQRTARLPGGRRVGMDPPAGSPAGADRALAGRAAGRRAVRRRETVGRARRGARGRRAGRRDPRAPGHRTERPGMLRRSSRGRPAGGRGRSRIPAELRRRRRTAAARTSDRPVRAASGPAVHEPGRFRGRAPGRASRPGRHVFARLPRRGAGQPAGGAGVRAHADDRDRRRRGADRMLGRVGPGAVGSRERTRAPRPRHLRRGRRDPRIHDPAPLDADDRGLRARGRVDRGPSAARAHRFGRPRCVRRAPPSRRRSRAKRARRRRASSRRRTGTGDAGPRGTRGVRPVRRRRLVPAGLGPGRAHRRAGPATIRMPTSARARPVARARRPCGRSPRRGPGVRRRRTVDRSGDARRPRHPRSGGCDPRTRRRCGPVAPRHRSHRRTRGDPDAPPRTPRRRRAGQRALARPPRDPRGRHHPPDPGRPRGGRRDDPARAGGGSASRRSRRRPPRIARRDLRRVPRRGAPGAGVDLGGARQPLRSPGARDPRAASPSRDSRQADGSRRRDRPALTRPGSARA